MIASPHLHARAEMVARTVAESRLFVAFPFDALIGVLTELVPIIINGCFRPSSGEEAARYVAARYRARQARSLYGGYPQWMVDRLAEQAIEAAPKYGAPLDRYQAHELALRTLDSVRTGDAEQVSAILAEQEREQVPTIVPE